MRVFLVDDTMKSYVENQVKGSLNVKAFPLDRKYRESSN
jgi:hypothetical protein